MMCCSFFVFFYSNTGANYTNKSNQTHIQGKKKETSCFLFILIHTKMLHFGLFHCFHPPRAPLNPFSRFRINKPKNKQKVGTVSWLEVISHEVLRQRASPRLDVNKETESSSTLSLPPNDASRYRDSPVRLGSRSRGDFNSTRATGFSRKTTAKC